MAGPDKGGGATSRMLGHARVAIAALERQEGRGQAPTRKLAFLDADASARALSLKAFKGNALKDFRDKKLSLRRCQVPSYEVRVNEQTKHSLRIARRFGLNHDLRQHRSSTAFHRFVLLHPKGGPAPQRSSNGAEH
jgi:hypothetical protein